MADANVRCVKCESRWTAPLVDGRSPPCATCGATATYSTVEDGRVIDARGEISGADRALDYDLGIVDRAHFAVFLANGHLPLLDGRSIETSWYEEGWPDRLHVGPQCLLCGYRHCESCDSAASIPACDGAVGMARRLRERADVWRRVADRADAEATAAEERLRAEDDR